MTKEKKTEIFRCILNQFPDEGIYRIDRVTEWLSTNGYSLEKLGYADFRSFAEDFPEGVELHPMDDGNTYVIIKKWSECTGSPTGKHPADSFFGSHNLILNDDIIEMSQQSLYALTKVLGNGLSVQAMKQFIYDRFAAAKEENSLNFFAERYTFPIDCCTDGFLVNGIITKNLSPRGKSLYFSFEKTAIFNTRQTAAPTRIQNNISVSDSDKEEIYRLLSASFPFERPQHMAAVSKLLTDNNIDRSKFGCIKMKELLSQMDFLELEDVILGGVPQIMVTLHKSARYPDTDIAAECTDYRKTPTGDTVPSQRLDEFCNIPSKPLAILENYLHTNNLITNEQPDLHSILCKDFEAARDKLRFHNGKMIFPCRYSKSDGSPIEITLKKSTYDGKPWFLYYIDTIPHTQTGTVFPGQMLEHFAFLGTWNSFLAELASKAMPEEWDFPDAYAKDNYILIQYMKYTFYRIVQEDKLCISGDKRFAAFNTGLIDSNYDDIYACFLPNEANTDTCWKFSGFCTAASRGPGKTLVSCFNPLPQPAEYCTQNEQLLFDSEKPMHIDYQRIIIDSIKRLPVQFLNDQFTDCPEAQELAEKLMTADKFEKRAVYAKLKGILSENSRLFTRIQNRVKDAVEIARKCVSRNYKAAVPAYFPNTNSFALLLPLCLTHQPEPDVALVVEVTKSGNYQTQNILTIPQAYIDARLICPLDNGWLHFTQCGSAAESNRKLSGLHSDN
ncbi:MAG: DUF3825 domain-containing protein [Oscillospiraceae bacterium]